ncbi:DNA polymerase III subunit beta family protein [Kitasatospora cineracea]
MSTELPIKAAVNARELQRILSQVEPHVNSEDFLPAIAGIRLEGDGRHLIAIATDRYTMGIARTPLRSDAEPWAVTVPGRRVKSLRQWLKAQDRLATVVISPTETTVTFESPADELRITTAEGDFPKWRGMIAKLIADDPQPVPLTSYTAEFLARWASAGSFLAATQAAADKPLLLFGENFLGLQMPASRSDDRTREKTVAEWADTLDLANTTPVEVEQPKAEGNVAVTSEQLLYRIAVSTADVVDLAHQPDPHLMAMYAITSCNAWTAYRLLQELQKLSPSRTAKLLGALNEELEAGDFSEIAWEYALQAGHDPEKWVEEHDARRKARAEKAAAEAA